MGDSCVSYNINKKGAMYQHLLKQANTSQDTTKWD